MDFVWLCVHSHVWCVYIYIYIHSCVSADPLKRWGLIAPGLNDFLRIACVFSGYHAVRREFKRTPEIFNTNQTSLTGSQIRVAWTVFASAFHVEACEVCVPCRHFSVASFLSCLQHNSEFASCTVDARPDVTWISYMSPFRCTRIYMYIICAYPTPHVDPKQCFLVMIVAGS